jgi:hypothetical protein
MLHLVSLATSPTAQAAAAGDVMTDVVTRGVAIVAVVVFVGVVLARISPEVVDVLLTVRSVVVAVVVVAAIAVAVFAVTVGVGALAGVAH